MRRRATARATDGASGARSAVRAVLPTGVLARSLRGCWQALLACGLLLATVASGAQSDSPAADADAPRLLRFDGVQFEGIEGPPLDNLRRSLSLARLKRGTSIRPERFDYLLRILPREARAALEPFGYYSPQLRIEPQRGESLSVSVRVDAGAPVKVRKLDVQVLGAGGRDARVRAAIEAFAPAPGEVLLHERYEAAKAELQRRLAARGYFLAELVEARVEVTRALGAADVVLRFDSGPRFRFGAVEISGSPLREGLLRPLLPFAAEDLFLQSRLLELQRRLADLDYFDRIDIQPRELAADEAVTAADPAPAIGIDLQLDPAPRNVYGAGISVGSDTGAALKLSYGRRWLNAAGHKFAGELLLGQQRSVAAFSYRIPAFERYTGWWSAQAKFREEPFASLDSRVVELALTRDARWRGNLFTLGWHAQQERYADRRDVLAWPEASVERKVVDDPLYPTRGFYWRLTGRWGLRGLGSDTEFRQAIASALLVRGFTAHDRVILRAEAATTSAASFERLPPSLRFYAGGDRSVRGYGYQELSPLFEGDQRVGAPRLAVASVEWEHMFGREWGAALFVDAGNAYASRLDPAVGVGIGLRWRSPVGPIRLDLGHGLDDPEQAFRLHVQLGPEL